VFIEFAYLEHLDLLRMPVILLCLKRAAQFKDFIYSLFMINLKFFIAGG